MTADPGRTRPRLEIGRDRRRKEDQRLITGRTRWTDNITLPGMLHLAMVRSPYAHANIVSIDTAAAKAMTNVVDVFTGKDFGDELGVCINAWPITPDQVTPDALADAEPTGSPSPARSSPSSWPAPPPRRATPPSWSTSSTRSCRPRSTSRRPPRTRCSRTPTSGTNKSALWVFDSAEAGTGGDVEEAIAKARTDGIVIEREYRQQRLIPAFMEPRSVVVDPTGEQYTMWSATQIPHILRFALAATTGVPESKIRVIAPDVGGGFGGKLQVTPEEWIAWAVGRRIGKPVKYTETRSESPAQRPTTAATSGRSSRSPPRRTARSPASRSSCSPTSAPTSRSSAAACRCWVPSCSTRSTSSRPTTSPARRSSPTRPGPTPTAAPAGPRRRTASSG